MSRLYPGKVLAAVLLCLVLCYVVSEEIMDLGSAAKNAVWTVFNIDKTIAADAHVPGGIYSDLMLAGVIPDILYRFNDIQTRWVAKHNWTYITKFYIQEDRLQSRATNLVLYGVDTIAHFELNEKSVYLPQNMFISHILNITGIIQIGENTLTIRFKPATQAALTRSFVYYKVPGCIPQVYKGECHVNQVRKMQISFGWDWAPAFPSVGLWKPIELQFFYTAVIRYVTTHFNKVGDTWNINLRITLNGHQRFSDIGGYIETQLILEDNYVVTQIDICNVGTDKVGEAVMEVKLSVNERMIKLWWPNGYGDQNLYELTVTFRSRLYNERSEKRLLIGFRTVKIVEEYIGLRFNSTSMEGNTFYFEVNGIPMFMKGSTWVPVHILPEHTTNRETVRRLLTAAKEAHMTMLHVWGGGVYESDYFYELCDQFGILIWQDFMFTTSSYPTDSTFIRNVHEEITQVILRLQYHPCIAVWVGSHQVAVALEANWFNIKDDYDEYLDDFIFLFIKIIKPVVTELDPSRTYLISSPSNGNRINATNGYDPIDSKYGDSHYYNFFEDGWSMNIYPMTRFASDYGFQSLPSIATMMTSTNLTEDLSVRSSYSIHREHNSKAYSIIHTQIRRHLKLDKNDKKFFEKFVFYSQISQAMAVKAQTEFYRQSRHDWYTMGALYGQLNDVWQAPSCSSIEYTGRWKMLHYFAMSFFAPILISPRVLPSGDVIIFIINDWYLPITKATIVIETFLYNSTSPIHERRLPCYAPPLSVTKQRIIVNARAMHNPQYSFVKFSLIGEEFNVLLSPENYVFPTALKYVKNFKKPNLRILVGPTIKRDGRKYYNYDVTISTDTVVLFLWLESEIMGYFDKNGLILTQAEKKILFLTKKYVSPQTLQKSITLQYYIH